jgi:hypothetical protein
MEVILSRMQGQTTSPFYPPETDDAEAVGETNRGRQPCRRP